MAWADDGAGDGSAAARTAGLGPPPIPDPGEGAINADRGFAGLARTAVEPLRRAAAEVAVDAAFDVSAGECSGIAASRSIVGSGSAADATRGSGSLAG